MVATKDKEDINDNVNEGHVEGGGRERERGAGQKTKPKRHSKMWQRNKMLGIFCIVSHIKSHNNKHTRNAQHTPYTPPPATHTHTHLHLQSGVNAAKGFAGVFSLFCFQLFVVLV